jgi:hypothetical protein
MTDQTPETQTETSVKKTRARVSKAVEEGVADAKEATAVILPALGESISKAVYGGCYHAAYYVTFGALAIARLIPADSAAARGLHDGAETAAGDFKAYEQQKARLAAAAVSAAVPADSGTG